jgi:hypothetical protein
MTFSLLSAPQEPLDHDLNLQMPDDLPAEADQSWMDRLHTGIDSFAEANEMPEPGARRAVSGDDARAAGGCSPRTKLSALRASRRRGG